MRRSKLFPLILASVMTALGTVIYMVFPEIPLVPGVEYLKVDLSDIPALVTGLTVGPIYGVSVEIFKNLIHLTRTTTFGIGELMNVCIGSSMILSMWLSRRLISRAISNRAATYYIAGGITIVVTIIVGWTLNAALTPIFYTLAGFPLTTELLLAGVWGSTLLNTIKSAVTILPFWPLVHTVNKVSKRFC